VNAVALREAVVWHSSFLHTGQADLEKLKA
jgi:hypothetical protein